jgi:hypothetical protein
MRLTKLVTRRAAAGAVGLACGATALAWGVGFGVVRPDINVALPRDRASDVAYTRPRASAAVAGRQTLHAVRIWNFDDGLPRGWEASSGTRVESGSEGITFRTGLNSDIQLHSPPMRLPRGTYRVLIEGGVSSGGLQAGAEAGRGRDCSSAAYFDAKSTTPPRSSLPVLFTADPRRPVRIVLANWADRSRSSLWHLRQVRVLSIPAPDRAAAHYAALASPLVRIHEIPVTNLRFRWRFARRLPSDWFVNPGVSARPVRSGLAVRTTRDAYAFALTTKVTLGAGPYLLRFDGRIVRGGLTLGALDEKTDRWLGQHFYWSDQNGSPGTMAVRFSVRRQTRVVLVLANWATNRSTSRWSLRGVELDQLF